METFLPLLEVLIGLAVFLVTLAGLDFISVEGIKKFMQMLQKTFDNVSWLKRPLELLTPSGDKTFFLALIMAFVYVAGFDLDVFGDFSAFDSVNPVLLDLMQTALITYGGHLVNKQS